MNENTATKQAKEETKSVTGQMSETVNAYKEKVGEYTQQGLEKANQLKQQAADIIASSSDYVKNFDVEKTKQQIRTTVKQKPEISIAIAGIFGLLIGLLIGRRR